MKNITYTGLTVLAAMLLAGCSTSGGGGAAMTAPGTKLAPQAALSAYTAVEAKGTNTLKAAEAAGIQGFGVVSGSRGFATTAITRNDTSLTVEAGGKKYNLPSLGNDTLGGVDVAVYGTVEGGYPVGNNAAVLSGQHGSITVLAQNMRDKGTKIDGYAVSVTGLQTPVASMPNANATYLGAWAQADTLAAGNVGDFSATADFGAKTVDFTLNNMSGGAAGTAKANINGNQFIGTMNLSGGASDLIGGFYGPAAEEIAGVSNGAGYSAVLAGVKQ